ncbi:MAG: hypothetical protein OXH15_02315 [Gammaproteobacteria bacterium]|nr:hypothetical protein [Gammaproteobacteria bacterium]
MRSVAFLLAAVSLLADAATDPCGQRYTPEALLTAPVDEIRGVPMAADAAYRVATIDVVRQHIFNTDDPAESKALFRLANLWHINTREDVIRTLLLFEEGDSVTAERIEESERLLRRQRFLYDGRVVANRQCDGDIDVAVVTRDVWSLLLTAGITRTGGKQEFEIGVSEINLLGTGADLDFEVFENLDRDGLSLGFADTNIANSRVGVRFRYEDTDDGQSLLAHVGQPFYAYDARRAWDLRAQESTHNRRLYRRGQEIATFAVDSKLAQASVGWSKGLVDGYANRFNVGFTIDEQRLDAILGVEGLSDRAFAYPWVSFERIEDEYAKTRNLDRVQTTEDVFLGKQFTALLGYSPRGDGFLVGSTSWRDGWRFPNDDVLLYGLQASGFWNAHTKRAENVVSSAWARYRHRHTPRLALHLDAEATVTDQLDPDQQILAGGDSGLRGYPNRFQAGSHRFRLTAEERFYTDLYLARVLRVAAAAFVDVGRAWDSKHDNDVLANVGVGLRFESTRTDRSLVYHIDLAFPLVDGPGVGGAEITLTSKRNL